MYLLSIRILKKHNHDLIILKWSYLKKINNIPFCHHNEWGVFKHLLSRLNSARPSRHTLHHDRGSLHTYNDFSFFHSVDLDIGPHCSLHREIAVLGIDHGTLDQTRTPGSERWQLVKKNSFVTQPVCEAVGNQPQPSGIWSSPLPFSQKVRKQHQARGETVSGIREV